MINTSLHFLVTAFLQKPEQLNFSTNSICIYYADDVKIGPKTFHSDRIHLTLKAKYKKLNPPLQKSKYFTILPIYFANRQSRHLVVEIGNITHFAGHSSSREAIVTLDPIWIFSKSDQRWRCKKLC